MKEEINLYDILKYAPTGINPEKKLFAKKGEWFECIQVPKTHMQYKFNKYVQYCSNSDNCICDNSGEDVYIPTYIKDFENHFVKINLTK